MTALLILLNILVVCALSWIATRRDVSLVLTIGLILTYAMWYAVPTGTGLAAWGHIASRAFVSYDDFVEVATMETAALLAILVTFALGKRRWTWMAEGRLSRLTFSSRMLSVLIVATIAVSLVCRKVILDLVGTNYLETNAFAVYAEGTVAAGVLGILFIIFTTTQAFLFACLITPARNRPFWIVVLLWAWLIIITVTEVLLGSRIALLAPCILFLMWMHQRHISRLALAVAYAAIGFFVATVGVTLTVVIAQIRDQSAISINSAQAESKRFVEQDTRREEQFWLFFDHVNLKFDIFSAGALLLRHGEGEAGFKPYVGAFLSVVPRRLVPSKPVPGSIDGTNRGLPTRLVAVDMGYPMDIGNVGVSPGAVAVWEFGKIGLLALVFVTTLNLRLMNSLLTSPSIPLRTLALYVMTIPTFVGVVNSPDYLILNGERALAIYIAASLVMNVLALLRRPRGKNPHGPHPASGQALLPLGEGGA